MYQVIARKYRPQDFEELISQEHVKTTLENAITLQRIAHGYIFSGQRGTGKTTVARIFARCLNCADGPTAKPCGQCASCREITAGSSPDVIEIDAASNRGINEMRELRESVRYRPSRDRYKVFIVDEAHQITNEAFNALLKTLEEPPEWVVFILCTTESHKIPATIISRCQQFSFRSVDFASLVTRMEWIAQQEGITADAEVWSVLAQVGEGSVRDSLSAMDQAIACCGNQLNAGEVRSLLGMFALESLAQITEALQQGEPAKMFAVVAELEANGRSLQHFARELARYIRNLLVIRIANGPTKLVAASESEQKQLTQIAQSFSEEDLTRYLQLTLNLFRDLQSSLLPRLHLEVGLLRMVYAGRMRPIEEVIGSLSGANTQVIKPTTNAPPPNVSKPLPAVAPARVPAPETAVAVPNVNSGDFRSRLYQALTDAKRTFEADAVAHSEVKESPGEILFLTPKMYQMNLKSAEFEAMVNRVAGRTVRISAKTDDGADKPATVPAASAAPQNDELRDRALSHPEVQRFQELFPDSQVRNVRNLKD